MTTFHVGQEVEVLFGLPPPGHKGWRNAKIVREPTTIDADRPLYDVEFPDGHRAGMIADYIRAVTP